MEHGKKYRKFGRVTKQRSQLMRGLAESLITHGKITTTQAKAKSLKQYVEKIISKSKKSDLASTRFLASQFNHKMVKKISAELAPRYISRSGGYTRIINLPRRISDGAQMAQIELLQ